MVNKKEHKKPMSKPLKPMYFNSTIDNKIPKIPWNMDSMVGTLFNFNADKKTTETLSNMIKQVNTKYKWYKDNICKSLNPIQ